MKIRNLRRYIVLRDSIKDLRLNKILDEMILKKKISDRDKEFLSKYDEIVESDVIDLSHLSKNDAYSKIKLLLGNKKRVICDLYDRDGKIDDDIIGIENDFEDDLCTIYLKHGETIELHDRYLYDIRYDFDSDSYSLWRGEEFYEKISIDNED